MRKFIVLDPTLRDLGGHHFDYAYHVLRAADQLGFDTVLACHQRFDSFDALPPNCRVVPVFRHHSYSRHSDLPGIQSLLPEAPRKTSTPLRVWYRSLRRQLGRRKRIRSFANACRDLFRDVCPSHGDHVLVATASDMELLGLSLFLQRHPPQADMDWHLQFHFDLFEGREPEYATQFERLPKIKSHFQSALGPIQGERVHFYNTSLPLARQYNSLGVGCFEPLAYPVNPAFHATVKGRVSSPLAVICPGQARKEKGLRQLSAMLADLWQEVFVPGHAQLVLQVPFSARTAQPETVIATPTPNVPHAIRYVPHPQPMSSYVELIQQADIGLLLHDSRRYYSRRAGVLGEFLAAGTPVIVPAGCWLAEQVAEPIYRFQESLTERGAIVHEVDAEAWLRASLASTNESLARGGFIVGDKGHPTVSVLSVPRANRLLVSFQWSQETSPGTYVQVQAKQYDNASREIDSFVTIVGQRASDRVPILLPLHREASTVTLHWSNAYWDQPILLRELRGVFLETGCQPLGAVGLIAAPGQVSRLLRDLIAHHDHYRETARSFSGEWFARHDPRETVRQLVHRGGSPAKWAA